MSLIEVKCIGNWRDLISADKQKANFEARSPQLEQLIVIKFMEY